MGCPLCCARHYLDGERALRATLNTELLILGLFPVCL